MATSGIIRGTVSQRSSWYRADIHWRRTSVDNSGNRSKVYVQVLVSAESSGRNWNGTVSNFRININGTEYSTGNFNSNTTSSWTYVPNNSPIGNGWYSERMYSREVWVKHKSDGSKTFSVNASFSLPSGGYGPGNVSISGNGTLNTIPRESSISSSASWTAGNSRSVSISRASTSFTHTVRWQVKDSGGTWRTVRTATGVKTSNTGSFTTSQNRDIFNRLSQRASTESRISLETFNGSTKIGSTVYKYGTVTAPSASTATITNPTGVSRFSGQGKSTVYIDQDIKISISRKNSGFTHTINFKDGNSGSIIHQATGVGTTYTWSPTKSERDEMYNKTPNSIEFDGQIDVYTYYDNVLVRSSTNTDINYRVRNSNPIFTLDDVSYKDVAQSIVDLTGNDQYIVQNQSSLRVYIDNAATAQNGATIKRYIITVNGIQKTRSTPGYSTIGAIDSRSNVTLTVKAEDSRGNTKTINKTINIIPYSRPSMNARASRLNGFENETTLKLNGSISPVTIDGINLNSVQLIEYRYRIRNGQWNPWYEATYNASGTTYSMDDVVFELDNLSAWDIEMRVTDRFSNQTVKRIVDTGQPILFIDTEKKSVSVNKFSDKNNAFEVMGDIYADGDKPVPYVVEADSNANGRYIRYSDGWQICVTEMGSSEIGAVDIASGSLWRSQTGRWYFPAEFINSVDVNVSANISTYLRWVNAYVMNNDYATIVQYATSSSDVGYTMELMAIGRWK